MKVYCRWTIMYVAMGIVLEDVCFLAAHVRKPFPGKVWLLFAPQPSSYKHAVLSPPFFLSGTTTWYTTYLMHHFVRTIQGSGGGFVTVVCWQARDGLSSLLRCQKCLCCMVLCRGWAAEEKVDKHHGRKGSVPVVVFLVSHLQVMCLVCWLK